MPHTLELARRAARLRTILAVPALLALFAGACNSVDDLATEPTVAANPNHDGTTTDSPAAADSVALTSISLAFASRSGTPFGPDGLWASYTGLKSYSQPFNASINSDSPSGIITRINTARRLNQQLALVMTGGAHTNYTTYGKFDFGKWKARMDLYRTTAIRTAVAAAVADGTVLMSNMMDEPNHPSWGGVMTKPLLDRMASYVKSIFPTLPAGVSVRWDWRPYERYRVVDFIQTQYVSRFGSVTTWRDQALAAARLNGIKLVMSFNPINGGTRIAGCPLGPTGGWGTYGGNCRMTPTQVRVAGTALGASGCALLMWRYDLRFMSKAANILAFNDVKARLALNQRRSCRRS